MTIRFEKMISKKLQTMTGLAMSAAICLALAAPAHAGNPADYENAISDLKAKASSKAVAEAGGPEDGAAQATAATAQAGATKSFYGTKDTKAATAITAAKAPAKSGQRASIAGELKKMMREPERVEKKPFATLVEESQARSYPSVLPEITTAVELSSSDVNRLTCQDGDIKDVSFSEEKGVLVKFTAKDAFVKFSVKKRGDEMVYASTPSEFFVVCGDNVYNLILNPKRIPAQVVRLSTGKKDKIKSNVGMFADMPFEKKVLALVQQVYTDELADSFTVETPNTPFELYADLEIVQTKTIMVEGEGVRLKEFVVRAKSKSPALTITERDFLRSELTRRPVAITVDKMKLYPGESARVIIAELTQETEK